MFTLVVTIKVTLLPECFFVRAVSLGTDQRLNMDVLNVVPETGRGAESAFSRLTVRPLAARPGDLHSGDMGLDDMVLDSFKSHETIRGTAFGPYTTARLPDRMQIAPDSFRKSLWKFIRCWGPVMQRTQRRGHR